MNDFILFHNMTIFGTTSTPISTLSHLWYVTMVIIAVILNTSPANCLATQILHEFDNTKHEVTLHLSTCLPLATVSSCSHFWREAGPHLVLSPSSLPWCWHESCGQRGHPCLSALYWISAVAVLTPAGRSSLWIPPAPSLPLQPSPPPDLSAPPVLCRIESQQKG